MILTVRHLQRTPYSVALAQMQACVKNADHHRDQIWLLEHPPVYTQGIAGKAQHMLAPSTIPLIQSDNRKIFYNSIFLTETSYSLYFLIIDDFRLFSNEIMENI